MVLLIIIPIKWLFHWEYTLFSDKPICLLRGSFWVAIVSFGQNKRIEIPTSQLIYESFQKSDFSWLIHRVSFLKPFHVPVHSHVWFYRFYIYIYINIPLYSYNIPIRTSWLNAFYFPIFWIAWKTYNSPFFFIFCKVRRSDLKKTMKFIPSLNTHSILH